MTDKNNRKLDVSIIIVNWNTDKLLEQCLSSVIQNTHNISYEIFVIDNNSMGTGFERVKKKFSKKPNLYWFKNKENIGALACNQVLPYCRGRYILLLGPDTIVLPNAIDRMVEFLDNRPEAGAVTAKLLNPDGSPQNYYYKFWNLQMLFFSTSIGKILDKVLFKGRFERYYFGGDINPNEITIVEQPCAACFMFRRDPIALDYIIDKDFPFYFNDVELCRRIYEKGFKIFLLPTAQVIHFQGSSFKKADGRWKSKEYRLSAIKYFKKYYGIKFIFAKLLLMLDNFVNRIYSTISQNWIEMLKKELSDCSTVLDLGCGYNSPIQYCNNINLSVGVEMFEPYLKESVKKRIHDEYIKGDIRRLEFKPKSFDAVLCLELIEHLTKEEGYELIKKMEKWARKKIIITTPNGYLWQDGYDNNPLQMHRSGWSVDELKKLGFEVYGISGWKKLRGYRGQIKYKPKLFWTIISGLTQKITYRCPRFAFQLFAIKYL